MSTDLHGSPRHATLLWASLIMATLLTRSTEAAGATGLAAVGLLITLSLYKGVCIILEFMALRHAPLLWRALMLGWLGVVWALIVIAYIKELPQ